MDVRLSLLLLLLAVAGASTDSGALRGFLSDPGHTVPGDPSLIPGVTNDAGGAATRIALPAAGLTGSLSPAIGRLPALRELSLPENRLSGVLPQELYLGGASIPSSSFAVATNLLILSLSNNNFSGSIPSFICNLTHLVILDLSNNNFFGELPNCWQKSQLGTVESQNDSMSGHSQSLVAGPISLQSLHMRNNNLSGGIPLFLKYCKNLSVLDLSENKFSGNLPNWFGENLASLKVLSLRSNSFSGNIPE